MDGLTLIFVTLILGAAIILTLSVRSQILRQTERLRNEPQHEDIDHRRNAHRVNPRSATRR